MANVRRARGMAMHELEQLGLERLAGNATANRVAIQRVTDPKEAAQIRVQVLSDMLNWIRREKLKAARWQA